MTPYQTQLAEQASTELDSTKLLDVVDKLCRAIDAERESNHQLRLDCQRDCKEHGDSLPLPLVVTVPEMSPEW
jgi:hypothetical protein